MHKKQIAATAIVLLACSMTVYAGSSGDESFWNLYKGFRKGLFWIGIFSSLYGLYIQVLKRDDGGKKIIITSTLCYVASYVIPAVFIGIDQAFSK